MQLESNGFAVWFLRTEVSVTGQDSTRGSVVSCRVLAEAVCHVDHAGGAVQLAAHSGPCS
jgi:hypothetical protein